MSTTFSTESGSTYEIRNTPWDNQEIRRINTDYAKRADDQWIRLINTSALVEGYPIILEMESLAEYGPDDTDTYSDHPVTTRTTSVVTKIWSKA